MSASVCQRCGGELPATCSLINSVKIEFENGQREIVSRYAIRRKAA